ncbi:MAG: helix-turn-helix domain-containing protein [Planctomycetota bacterium]
MPPEVEQAGPLLGVRRAWVADRSLAVASALGGVLSDAGWEAEGFADAEGLMAALDRVTPDAKPGLLLLDLHLPRGGAVGGSNEAGRPPRSLHDEPMGFELLPELRLREQGLAVVLLVEFARLETAVKAVRLGAADVLVKPIPDDRLIASAEGAVSRQALMQSAVDQAETQDEPVAGPQPEQGLVEVEGLVADSPGVVPLSESMEAAERVLIRRALDAHGWARTVTAEALGINRATLYKKMRVHGLDQPGEDWPQRSA